MGFGPHASANVIPQLDMQLGRLNCHAKQDIVSNILTSMVAVFKSSRPTSKQLSEPRRKQHIARPSRCPESH